MKLVIKRDEWRRGNSYNSWLLSYLDNTKCCLGFFGQQLGISDFTLTDGPEPIYSAYEIKWPNWLFSDSGRSSQSEDCIDLIQTNDSSLLSEEEREKRITEIFAEHDVQVEFV